MLTFGNDLIVSYWVTDTERIVGKLKLTGKEATDHVIDDSLFKKGLPILV